MSMSPEERAAELGPLIQSLTFTAWGRQEPEHHEAAAKLAKKVVALIRAAEHDARKAALEEAATAVDGISTIKWCGGEGWVAGHVKDAASRVIRSLKHT